MKNAVYVGEDFAISGKQAMVAIKPGGLLIYVTCTDKAVLYNLFVFLTQQYFGQIEENLQAAIFANVYNYYVFRVSEADAKALEGNLKMDLPRDVVEQENRRGIKEEALRIRMLTELHPRECIVRVLSKGQLAPCIKVRTLDAPVVAQRQSPSGIDLQKYILDPATQNMPTKFVEQYAQSSPAAPSPEPQVAAPPGVPIAPDAAATASPPTDLSEVLSSQSSGTNNNQRKDTP